MDILKKNNENEIIISKRKKRNRNTQKDIFEIYKSEKTIKDYMFYLRDFLHFVYEGDNQFSANEILGLVSSVDKEDIENYIVHLFEDRKLKKTSVNKILSALKSIYNELERKGLENPAKYIKLFKVNRDIENILKLSSEDIKNIIGLYKVDSEKSYRNLMILYTLFYTGMRSAELLKLKFKNLLERENNYYFKLENTKSGKDVYKPIHSDLLEKLLEYKKYLLTLHNINNDEFDNHFIFCSEFEKNNPISYRMLNNIIKDMGKLINKSISPHNIRHSVATELAINGANILEIRDFLGHSDTRATEIYINANTILEKKILDKINKILK